MQQGHAFYTGRAFHDHEMPFKKDFSVFTLLADTWYDHCKALHIQLCFFVLKICTDTYKIIDKNIPLLTIRLEGKPCERLGGGRGEKGGRAAGWLSVGLRWETETERGGRRGGSLGSGATRTWPPPWPPRGQPPPGGRRQEDECWEHSYREQNKVRISSHPPASLPSLSPSHPTIYLVGLGLSILRVVLLVGLSLGVLLRLLGLLVLFLVVHSLFFLQWEKKTLTSLTHTHIDSVPASNAGFFTADVMTSRPRRVDSLTFAAFFTFGSGLGGPGFYQKKRKEKRNGWRGNRTGDSLLVSCLLFVWRHGSTTTRKLTNWTSRMFPKKLALS